MVCRELLAQVREVVEADMSIMKSVRKAREEREICRGANGKAEVPAKKEAGGGGEG